MFPIKIKKLITILFMLAVFTPTVSNANISYVSNVHDSINSLKNVAVPVDSSVENDNISSVSYLMKQIDSANRMLNGVQTTYATTSENLSGIASESKVATEVENLVIEFPKFELTLQGVNAFSFQISASGYFIIDWGDGTVQEITKSDTTNTTYSHTYSSSGDYNVKIRGKVTGYNSITNIASISFTNSTNKTLIKTISGGLGKIFTSVNGVSPRFYETFMGCSGLTGSIPADLFAGINGTPSAYMFYSTFDSCTGLNGSIPGNLFASVSGAPSYAMFTAVFYGCSGLTGTIPSELFASVSGAPTGWIFYATFDGCSGLTGSIPSGLFSSIAGAPSDRMFLYTFRNCTGLTSIPANLFVGLSGAPKSYLFAYTFYNCTGLTSIPAGLFSGIVGAPADRMFYSTFYGCSGLTGSIPAGLFSGISGTPAIVMYASTFQGCSGLTGSIPANLFGTFSGAPAANMFYQTFYGCSGLTGIDDGIWNLSGLTNVNTTNMFSLTFYGCSGITSASPNIAMGSSVKLYTQFSNYTSGGAFRNCTLMSDYVSIPAAWK